MAFLIFHTPGKSEKDSEVAINPDHIVKFHRSGPNQGTTLTLGTANGISHIDIREDFDTVLSVIGSWRTPEASVSDMRAAKV